jgi:metal-dependent amidase/aminoacylase/carboxypeptidase family protein
MNAAVEQLKAKSDEYAKNEAQKIIDLMVECEYTELSKSTCDHYNWDREYHRQFPKIAQELRKQGFTVTSSVNFGVTDWVITI